MKRQTGAGINEQLETTGGGGGGGRPIWPEGRLSIEPIVVDSKCVKKMDVGMEELKDLESILLCRQIGDVKGGDAIVLRWGYKFPKAYTVYEQRCRMTRQIDLMLDKLRQSTSKIQRLLKENHSKLQPNTIQFLTNHLALQK